MLGSPVSPRWLAAAALLGALALAGCSSNNPADPTATGPAITAPTTSTDPGTRYLDPATQPLGAVTVETPPLDGAWRDGQTSIARPVPGTPTGPAPYPGSPPAGPSGFGTPDGSYAPASPGGLPNPGVRRSPAPPPPPPLR